jgi:hypothetical protein
MGAGVLVLSISSCRDAVLAQDFSSYKKRPPLLEALITYNV